MKKNYILLFTVLASLVPNFIFSQNVKPDFTNEDELPAEFTNQFIERTLVPHVPKVEGCEGDWDAVIDSIWGPGPPTDHKLLTFHEYWETIDKHFACFQGIEDKWQELYDLYLPEIEQGVSRGRFAAIMDQLSLSLRDPHTNPRDQLVHDQLQLMPGVPLMFVGGWGGNTHFGAGLTPLEDNTLLVYDVVDSHPLDLQLGDRVLGYEGVLWKDCYPQLLEAELPITGRGWGASPSSFHHSFMMAAGMNWHLFDTIDIVKYTTGDTLHLPTSLLENESLPIWCTEQMDIPGVPKPAIAGAISYGTVQAGDKSIGYIYGWRWNNDASTEFVEAVEALWDTDALIIDFRMNFGGNMFLSDDALDLLFSETISTIDASERCNDIDHQALCPLNLSGYEIGSGPDGFDKPIALLTGPGAFSSGDQVALRVKLHPNTRVFGKSTSTTFNSPVSLTFSDPDWSGSYARYDTYLLSDPGNYLTHKEFEVDEGVWHTPDAVANGEDAVVNAAIDWICDLIISNSEIASQQMAPCIISPTLTNGEIHIENQSNETRHIQIFDINGVVIHETTISAKEKSEVEIDRSGTFVVTVWDSKGYLKSEKIIVIK